MRRGSEYWRIELRGSLRKDSTSRSHHKHPAAAACASQLSSSWRLPANKPPPSRRRQVASSTARLGRRRRSQARNRLRSESLFSQSKRRSTVGVSPKAQLSCLAISPADDAATTAQIPATPVPNSPILILLPWRLAARSPANP